MAEDKKVDIEINVEEANIANTTSTTMLVETDKSKETDEKENVPKKGNKKGEKSNTVPLYKLFSFADSKDILLMIVGSVGACGNGVCTPLMTILMGKTINAFGGSSDTRYIVDEVTKVFHG